LGHGTKNPGKVEFDPAWENDLASYHRNESRILTGAIFSALDSLLDARQYEPYHQPNLPGGYVAGGV
jgi:hypothetical protein